MRYSIYPRSEKILSPLLPALGTLNRCRLRHNRDRGTAISGKAWKTVKPGKLVGGKPREKSYIFDTRYLLHSYSGSPFMEPYFTRNWASNVHCVDHNGRIITAAEHWPSASTFLATRCPIRCPLRLFLSISALSLSFPFLPLVQLSTLCVRSLRGL